MGLSAAQILEAKAVHVSFAGQAFLSESKEWLNFPWKS